MIGIIAGTAEQIQAALGDLIAETEVVGKPVATIEADGSINITTGPITTAPQSTEVVEETQEESSSPLGDEPVVAFTDSVAVGECLNINAIRIPKEMENNVSMGHDKMDVLMSGDGATPSTACLVTGVPGAGKTTMMLQLADCITKTGNIAVYNTCEESMVQVSRVARRLRLSHGFYISSHRSVFDLLAHVKSIQAGNPGKQIFMFVDSLQTVEIPGNIEYDEFGTIILDDAGQPKKRKGRPLGGSSVQVEVTKLLTNWCKKTYGVMFLIGQVNKDGDFSGRQAIKHWVDAHLHLDINRDRYSAEYGQRIAEMTKNRFGIAGIYYPFEIEARGIKFVEKKDKPTP